MTSKMVGSVLTLVILLSSVVGGAAQTYTQMQWGMNKGVTPYAFGANINGTWRDLGTVSAAGVWTIPNTNIGGLGTASTYNIGTNGVKVPLLSTANTWSGAQTISGSYNNLFNINSTLTGNIGLGYNTNISISSDNAYCAFCVDLWNLHYWGGSSPRGARVGLYGVQVQTAPTSGAGTTVSVGVAGIGQSNTGDGGTSLSNTGASGTYFGANFIVRNDGTNVYNIMGVENDVETKVGSSARYSFGSASVNFEAVQGSVADAGFVVYSGGQISSSLGGGPWGPGVGFHHGILFAELAGNGLVPIDSAGTVLGTHLESLSTIPAAEGIDLTGFTFSGSAFKSNLFSVSQGGVVFAVSYYANGVQGLTATKTVRDAAGTGTCTLQFTGGLYTGGTC
jgi:hypothetical protein